MLNDKGKPRAIVGRKTKGAHRASQLPEEVMELMEKAISLRCIVDPAEVETLVEIVSESVLDERVKTLLIALIAD